MVKEVRLSAGTGDSLVAICHYAIPSSGKSKGFVQSADYSDRLAQDEQIKAAPDDTIITRQPRGAAALVVPWNWPLAILRCKAGSGVNGR